MKKKQIATSKKIREMRLNSLSEKVRKLLDSIDHQTLIDKAEQWLLSLRKKQRIDLFERYFANGFSLTELEDYAVFVALAEEMCRDHVNRYLYPFDEPMGAKRIPIDILKSEIDDCPDDWITLFEAIICRIAKRHSVELPESIQQDDPDKAAENIEIDSLTKEQLAVIDRTVGSRNLSDIKCFLTQKCNIQDPTRLSWDDILNNLEFWLKSGQPPETEQKTSGGDTGEHQKENVLSGEPLALAMLVEHPDCSDTKIAETIGVNRTTLYDWPNFKKAKEALKQGRKNLPRGSKDGETGDIEAWNEKD